MSVNNPVKSLNPEVARKIAAGEVIDRPNAIIRELMDNAIDSGATSITVEIAGGGIEKIRIIDNGCGMTKEDLLNCARPHATSKIATEVDLMKLSTLGFRGEALASIAAVARLSIVSSGWKMRASITEDHILEPVAPTAGTIVMSEGLFENFPARRQFLKRAATEGLMCKNTFIEKAMARPDIAFRFIQDGEAKINLPAGQSIKDRFLQANSYSEAPELFYELSNSSDGNNPDWSFDLVIGEPAVSRSTKKEISIYTNGRKIQEYSLVQAVEYGGQGFFPNGTYPVAAVFIQVNPEMVDFNIHPAKKEARFYDISALHHGLSSTIKAFFQQYTYSNFTEDRPADDVREITTSEFDFEPQMHMRDSANVNNFHNANDSQNRISQITQINCGGVTGEQNSSLSAVSSYKETAPQGFPAYERHISYKASETQSKALSDFRSKFLGVGGSSSRTSASPSGGSFSSAGRSIQSASLAEAALAAQNGIPVDSKIRFIGSCLGTFLLAEKNSCLYIIDQHAAHERLLFDRLMKSQGTAPRQALLIPYKIRTESKSQDNQLEKLKEQLGEIGFEAEKVKDGEWEIKTIPDRWTGSEYDLRTLLFVKNVEPKEIIRSIAAMTACKAAVKDGYVLDDETAARLVEKAFTLEDPHCPHGRPIYTVISREKLFELVKRT